MGQRQLIACLLVIGLSASLATNASASTAVNDANGDGKSDCIALHRYVDDFFNVSIANWVFESSKPPRPTFSPSVWCRDGDIGNTVTGDFNGDGKADLISIMKLGESSMGMWMRKSTGTKYGEFEPVFTSSAWNVDSTSLATGDFDGDGRDELLAFYSYGASSTGVWLFDAGGDGRFSFPKLVFHSPYWSMAQTKLVSIRDETRSRVIAVYNYGGATTGFWVFSLKSSRALEGPTLAYLAKQWDAANSTFVGADFDGDGFGDLIAFYNYGGTTTGAFVFKSKSGSAGSLSGSSFSHPAPVFHSPYWSYSNSTFIPGDFDGDGKGEAGGVYSYSASKMGIWIFASDGVKLHPALAYTTPYWGSDSSTWLSPVLLIDHHFGEADELLQLIDVVGSAVYASEDAGGWRHAIMTGYRADHATGDDVSSGKRRMRKEQRIAIISQSADLIDDSNSPF